MMRTKAKSCSLVSHETSFTHTFSQDMRETSPITEQAGYVHRPDVYLERICVWKRTFVTSTKNRKSENGYTSHVKHIMFFLIPVRMQIKTTSSSALLTQSTGYHGESRESTARDSTN